MDIIQVVSLLIGIVCLVLLVTLMWRLLGAGSSGAGGLTPEQLQAASQAQAEQMRGEIRQVAQEIRQDFAVQRGELTQNLATSRAELTGELQKQQQAQGEQSARERQERAAAESEQRALLEKSLGALTERLHAQSEQSLKAQAALQETLRETLAAQQGVIREELEKMRAGNEAKLEQMRRTVDEQLQSTLEKRLSQSFALVSERLEKVQQGLGEMQNLAQDVGGLKKVLTNVKTRGGWGEVQLGRQLADTLTPEQYAENVEVVPGSGKRVEFAVRLPGQSDSGKPLWLPIDSKFPQEAYDRLQDAIEEGDKDALAKARKELETVIIGEAKNIQKYIAPPHSTDFAVMYLPTEGLFAEVIHNPGLASRLQREFRVTAVGPTLLMSLLNSLQLGFRTLAIEKRSAEVWTVLAEAKVEFQKYEDAWQKVGKHLTTLQNTVEQVGVRTRAVTRKLRGVEAGELLGGGSDITEEAKEEGEAGSPLPLTDALFTADDAGSEE